MGGGGEKGFRGTEVDRSMAVIGIRSAALAACRLADWSLGHSK